MLSFKNKEFDPELKKANHDMKKVQPEKVGRKCPKCGAELVYRFNKFKQKFIGCGAYPECKYAEFPEAETEKLDEKCPECGKPLLIRLSKFGKKFIGCSGYPKCHYMRNVNQTAEQAQAAAEARAKNPNSNKKFGKKQMVDSKKTPPVLKEVKTKATKKTSSKKTIN
ncbi:hypothetical protein FACS189496_4440 [Bacilli bacterium]|nr:hypothetical protein FACS189496_4440 [Bacilli bacterium]